MQKLRSLLAKLAIEALIISTAIDCRYFTGINSDFCYIIVIGGTTYYLTDTRYSNEARQKLDNIEVVEITSNNHLKTVTNLIDGCSVIGLDYNNLYHNDFLAIKSVINAEIIDISANIIEIRSIKSHNEIKVITKAIEISDIAFEKTLASISEGITERELATVLETEMLFAGADSIAFDSIVAFNSNSANPHWRKSDTKLINGSVVLMDFGACIDGYNSDITRTIAFGKCPKEFEDIYQIVLDANSYARDNIMSRMLCSKADNLAREHIEKFGYGEYFLHSLGHGVGIEVHEYPRLSKYAVGSLESGMIATVEPGIYLKDKYGVRIEDVILVNDKNSTTLTQSDRNYIQL